MPRATSMAWSYSPTAAPLRCDPIAVTPTRPSTPLEKNMSDTPQLLARLDAESAIHRLHATYIHRLDGGDFAGVADVLEHAVLHVLGTEASTRKGLLAFFEAGLQVHED